MVCCDGIPSFFVSMVPTDCTKCALCHSRDSVVLGRGSFTSKVMFVGEAPGVTEDETGLALVGDSGIMLEQVIKSIGMSSDDFYLTNLNKCRPPDNRVPSKAEQHACYPYFLEEIKEKQPRLIITLGNTPTRYLLADSKLSITAVRGKLFEAQLPIYEGRKKSYTEEFYLILPMLHPAALLRSESLEAGSYKYNTWQDIMKVAKIIKGEEVPVYKKLP